MSWGGFFSPGSLKRGTKGYFKSWHQTFAWRHFHRNHGNFLHFEGDSNLEEVIHTIHVRPKGIHIPFVLKIPTKPCDIYDVYRPLKPPPKKGATFTCVFLCHRNRHKHKHKHKQTSLKNLTAFKAHEISCESWKTTCFPFWISNL